MDYELCNSCNEYCDTEDIGVSEVSNNDVCPNCGMICPNCNKYITEKGDYLKTTNKCIGCDKEY